MLEEANAFGTQPLLLKMVSLASHEPRHCRGSLYLRGMAKEQHEKIEEFDEWLKQMFGAAPTRERMRMYLVDAFWHGQLEDTEILRAFRCSELGVQIVPELADSGRRRPRS